MLAPCESRDEVTALHFINDRGTDDLLFGQRISLRILIPNQLSVWRRMTSASFGAAVIPSLSASIPAQERINFEFMGEEIDHGADAQRDVAA